MSVNFNYIDSVLSLNEDELKTKEFDKDTEKFVIDFVQKYYDFIYEEEQKRKNGKHNINHFNIMLYEELIKIFPNDKSLLYKHIKDCIDNFGNEEVINIVRNDVLRLQICKNISKKIFNM